MRVEVVVEVVDVVEVVEVVAFVSIVVVVAFDFDFSTFLAVFVRLPILFV